MLVIARTVLLVLLLMLPLRAATQELRTRVIDTGPGLASVTVIPGGFYMVYDTGRPERASLVSTRVFELIPDTAAIDLLVLSHSDADHLGATDEIFERRRVRTVLRTGLWRTSQAWREADHAIHHAADNQDTEVFNLRHNQIAPGKTFHLGGATVTFLAGDHCPNHYHELGDLGDCTDGSEARNAGSIVLRLEYAGKSILFTGDAVGRKDDTSDTAKAIATEREILSRKDKFPIDSDVIIAPHHGADDGSSWEFIEEVSPKWVIFPAGTHRTYQHPRGTTANRYLCQGAKAERILRTDRGDNEGGKQWDHGATEGGDRVGDDDIDIIIGADGTLTVQYLDGTQGEGGTECDRSES